MPLSHAPKSFRRSNSPAAAAAFAQTLCRAPELRACTAASCMPCSQQGLRLGERTHASTGYAQSLQASLIKSLVALQQSWSSCVTCLYALEQVAALCIPRHEG